MGHHIYSLNTFAWTSFDGVHWKTHFFSRFFTKHVVLYRSFSSQTHSSTPPFSSCFKISEKAEQQKTKHNIQLKTARSVKTLNSARQLIHLQFHWDHRDCGNAAFRNFSYVTKHSRDFLYIISRLRACLYQGRVTLVLELLAHFFFLYTTCLQGR